MEFKIELRFVNFLSISCQFLLKMPKTTRDFVLSYIRAPEISEKVCEALIVLEVQIRQQAVNNLKQNHHRIFRSFYWFTVVESSLSLLLPVHTG